MVLLWRRPGARHWRSSGRSFDYASWRVGILQWRSSGARHWRSPRRRLDRASRRTLFHYASRRIWFPVAGRGLGVRSGRARRRGGHHFGERILMIAVYSLWRIILLQDRSQSGFSIQRHVLSAVGSARGAGKLCVGQDVLVLVPRCGRLPVR